MMGADLTGTIEILLENQLRDWDLAKANYAALMHTRLRTFSFEGFKVLAQFNPERIKSSAARVDPLSISARPCFLCDRNRPPAQKGIPYQEDYVILVNPYPVLAGHLTICAIQHVPQHIHPNFHVMLELAGSLPLYTIIYNGPRCGASAPDHFHFQAIPSHKLPVEEDFKNKTRCTPVFEKNGISVFVWNHYLRSIITLTGDNGDELVSMFGKIFGLLAERIPTDDDEPMLNIVTSTDLGRYIVHIFPRNRHRPDRYFATGEQQLLLSPASIDLGGILIMPREEDFEKISRADIRDVFRQVSTGSDLIQYLADHLK